jgi:hypothetical protein
LPILVGQALLGKPITYSELASKLAMPHPRGLQFPLACISAAVAKIAATWREHIPPITAMVVAKPGGEPGLGFDMSPQMRGKKWNTDAERRAIVQAFQEDCARYPRWNDVLAALTAVPSAASDPAG